MTPYLFCGYIFFLDYSLRINDKDSHLIVSLDVKRKDSGS